MEEVIVGCGNKHQSSRGGDRAAEIQAAGAMYPFCIELRNSSKWNFPGHFSGVRVDCPKLSPGRLLAGPELIIAPKARIVTPRAMPLKRGLRPLGILDQLSHVAQI